MTGFKVCTIEGCGQKYRARGLCATHWSRWKKYGTTDLPVRPEYDTCAADDCSDTPRSKHSPWCETHYYRIRRTGTHETTRIKRAKRGICIVEDCENLDAGLAGLCAKHHSRMRRNGDPLALRGPNTPSGPDNWNWTGDDATNTAVHQRIRKERGNAKNHFCIDCGGQAAHWSYDHTAQDERYCPEKGPYTINHDHYDPRCVSCHKKFDMGTIRRKAGAS